jgi:formate-dependent nitrite reductase membrane component NrfD
MQVPQSVWRWKVATYLFLAGVGAGSYVAGAVADWMGYSQQAKPAVILAVVLVAVSTLFLIWDLGVPGGFLRAFLNPGKSWISRGTWILAGFIAIGVIQIGLWIWPFRVLEAAAGTRASLEVLGSLFALATGVYTGILIGVLPGRPFWYSPMLPMLFLISALSTGIGAFALMLVVGGLVLGGLGGSELLGLLLNLARADMVLILLEAGAIYLHLAIVSKRAQDSVNMLTRGPLAGIFWGGFLVLGLLFPLVLEYVSVYASADVGQTVAALAASVFLLVGGLLLRALVLAAGARMPIYSRAVFSVRPGT